MIAEFLITVVSALSVCSAIRGAVFVRIGPVHFQAGHCTRRPKMTFALFCVAVLVMSGLVVIGLVLSVRS